MSGTTYYQRNREVILNRAKDYYENNKELSRERAKNKYRELSEEEKISWSKILAISWFSLADSYFDSSDGFDFLKISVSFEQDCAAVYFCFIAVPGFHSMFLLGSSSVPTQFYSVLLGSYYIMYETLMVLCSHFL